GAVRGSGKSGSSHMDVISGHADLGGEAAHIVASGQTGADDGGFDKAPALSGGVAAAPVGAARAAADAVACAGAHAALAGGSFGHRGVGLAVAVATLAVTGGRLAVGEVIAGHRAVLIGDKDFELDLGDF